MQNPAAGDVSRSRIAEFLRHLGPEVRAKLQVDDGLITGADMLVSLCYTLMDADSSQPWQDRCAAVFDEFTSGEAEAGLKYILTKLQDTDEAMSWITAFKGLNYQAFAVRLLGAAGTRRFRNAWKEDAAVAGLAIRRGLRGLMPFAVAWGDAIGNMTENQRKAVTKSDIIGLEIMKGLVQLDKALGKKFLSTLPMQLTIATADDLTAWRPDDMPEITASIRQRVVESSVKRLERENSRLVRKLRGAKDALKHSEDGISQAANSLVEVIDRILREAFSKDEALAWVEANLPNEPDLTHTNKDGKTLPTKRAEALCFFYRGRPTARGATEYDDGQGPALLEDVFARVFVATRDRLEKIKHADRGTPEERDQLVSLMTGLEGALMLGLFVSQIGHLPDSQLEGARA
ncbi:hypothetical protein ACFQL8_15080 [Streptomyces goshikiensis]|uniref:hypothetical protein n=1 Tax=Streptomyces goshikiensis TaxID=1942 RepID=UPI001675A2C7|nr:hypothetical protein [Streptomyces goshikiensis]GHD75497.1 hypothetical protein GCM10010336_51390 [Streptomyces goshikiensis]